MYNIFRRIGEIIIPTVYSDALSYGEYLGRLTNKLKEVIDWINGTKFVNTINGASGDVKLGTLHFSGYTDKSYDGSANVEVRIPTGSSGGEIAQLTFTGASTGVYDGSEAMTINIPSGTVASVNGKTGEVVLDATDVGAASKSDIPSTLPNPQSLTLKKNGETVLYDGTKPIEFDVTTSGQGVTSVNGKSGDVTLDANDVNAIPNSVTKLSNPYALILGGAVSATYDGSQAVTVNIPAGGGSSAVTSVNGQTGAVRLTAADVGATTDEQLPKGVKLAITANGTFSVTTGLTHYFTSQGLYLVVLRGKILMISPTPTVSLIENATSNETGTPDAFFSLFLYQVTDTSNPLSVTAAADTGATAVTYTIARFDLWSDATGIY